MTKAEMLNELFKKYNLYYDPSNPDSKDNDVYAHKHYKIITRTGIQKIEKATGIKCQFVTAGCGENYCVLKGTGIIGDLSYTTYASASSFTSQNKYYAEMAEKRCRSRLVLTLAGLYEHGVFGEDEADDFSSTVQEARKGVKVNPILSRSYSKET